MINKKIIQNILKKMSKASFQTSAISKPLLKSSDTQINIKTGREKGQEDPKCSLRRYLLLV